MSQYIILRNNKLKAQEYHQIIKGILQTNHRDKYNNLLSQKCNHQQNNFTNQTKQQNKTNQTISQNTNNKFSEQILSMNKKHHLQNKIKKLRQKIKNKKSQIDKCKKQHNQKLYHLQQFQQQIILYNLFNQSKSQSSINQIDKNINSKIQEMNKKRIKVELYIKQIINKDLTTILKIHKRFINYQSPIFSIKNVDELDIINDLSLTQSFYQLSNIQTIITKKRTSEKGIHVLFIHMFILRIISDVFNLFVPYSIICQIDLNRSKLISKLEQIRIRNQKMIDFTKTNKLSNNIMQFFNQQSLRQSIRQSAQYLFNNNNQQYNMSTNQQQNEDKLNKDGINQQNKQSINNDMNSQQQINKELNRDINQLSNTVYYIKQNKLQIKRQSFDNQQQKKNIQLTNKQLTKKLQSQKANAQLQSNNIKSQSVDIKSQSIKIQSAKNSQQIKIDQQVKIEQQTVFQQIKSEFDQSIQYNKRRYAINNQLLNYLQTNLQFICIKHQIQKRPFIFLNEQLINSITKLFINSTQQNVQKMYNSFNKYYKPNYKTMLKQIQLSKFIQTYQNTINNQAEKKRKKSMNKPIPQSNLQNQQTNNQHIQNQSNSQSIFQTYYNTFTKFFYSQTNQLNTQQKQINQTHLPNSLQNVKSSSTDNDQFQQLKEQSSLTQ